jgi:hypothetical protein
LDGISKTIQKSTLAPFPLEPFRHRRFQSIQSINLTKQSHFSFRIVAKVNNYLTMVRPNTRASGRQAQDEDLDNQRPSGRPQRTVKAPQVFTFSSPNNNDSSSPSKPSTKKKRKKRKKPSERTAQENLEAMRESRARNLPPSSDEEDDDLHKKPSALDLGVFTQYSADQDDVSNGDGDGGDSSPSNGSSGSAVNANNILASNQDTSSSNNSNGSDAQGNDDDSAARDDIDGQGPVVFEAVAGRNCDSQRSNQFWNALSVGNTQEVASILIDVKQERFENGEYVPPVDPRQYQQFQWQNNNVPPVHGLTDSDRAAAMVQDPSLLPPPLLTLNQQPVAWTQQPLNWSPEQLTDRIEAFDQQHGLVNQQAPRQVYHNPYRTSRPSSQVPILPRPPPNHQAPPPRTEVTPPIRQVPPPRPQVPPTNHQVPPLRPQVLPPLRPQVPPQDNQDSLFNHQVPPPNVQEPSLPLPPPQNQEQDSPEELGRASVSPPDQQDAGNGPSMDDAEDSAAAIAHALETDGLALDPEDAEFLGTVYGVPISTL